MRPVADYVVVRDAAFKLHTGKGTSSRSLSFTLPQGFRADRAAVLSFMADPNPSPGVRLQVFAGTGGARTTLVNEYTFSSGALRGMWEAFAPAPRKMAAGSNVMEFIAWSHPAPVGRNTGTIVVRDVIIWFKRDVD